MLNRIRGVKLGVAALLTGMVVTLIATGCGVAAPDLDITFYRNERYTVVTSIHIPPAMLDWVDRADLEQQLDSAVAEIKAEGVDASWSIDEDSKTGALTCFVTAKGQGYELLGKQVGIQARSVAYHGRQAIEVIVPSAPLAPLGVGWQSVTLHGAKILESDGIELERGTVTWSSSADGLHAILLPKGGMNGILLLVLALGIGGGIVGLVAVGAGAYVATRLRHQQKKNSNRVLPAATRTCPYCGAQVPQDARFCTSCGQELPAP